MNTMPRNYLSHSQKSSYLWSKERFLETYYYGKFEDNEYLKLGKELAEALEYREKKCKLHIRAIVDQIPDYPIREYKIEARLGDIPLMGVLDGYDSKKLIIGEYKSGQKESMSAWREQLLFYALLHWLDKKKLPKKIELTWARTMRNENEQLVFAGDVRTYIIEITLEDIILFSAKLKIIWEGIKELCEHEYLKFGILPIRQRKRS